MMISAVRSRIQTSRTLVGTLLVGAFLLTVSCSHREQSFHMKKGALSDLPFFHTDDVSLGIYPGKYTVEEYEKRLGVRFNHVLLFQNVRELRYKNVRKYLNTGHDVILTITFPDDHPNLKDIRDGVYDDYLIALAQEIVRDKRQIWIRPLHEFNGNWDSWDIFTKGNDPADFIPAWKHIVTLFRERKAPVRFQLNFNRVNVARPINRTPFKEFYPGDEWVDMAVISCYNRGGTDKYHKFWVSFDDYFDYPYRQALMMTDRPIGVAEIGSTSYGGDKPQWIIDAFRSFTTRFTRVTMITWFLYNRPLDNVIFDWDLNTDEDFAAFRKGLEILKEGKSGSVN
jgi:hypothetical protein